MSHLCDEDELFDQKRCERKIVADHKRFANRLRRVRKWIARHRRHHKDVHAKGTFRDAEFDIPTT